MQAEVFVYHREALLRRMDHYGFFKGHFVNRQVFYIFNSKTFSEVRLPSLVSFQGQEISSTLLKAVFSPFSKTHIYEEGLIMNE